jgi:catechol 2,3-dioxygenase-like lactoylglutathione lyase family enzyme
MLSHLEHLLVQTADIDKTVKWYVEVLGMRDGEHPDFKFPVRWLYIGARDVIHVTQGGAQVDANRMKYLGQPSDAVSGSGVIDHLGFRCSGLKETMAHLDGLKVAYQTRQVDDQGLFQLFLFDPNGIKVELNFPSSEAAGIAPQLKASSLP